MFKGRLVILLPLILGSLTLEAESLRLKGGASLEGKILAEKPDQVVIDMGYTVLVVPRENVQEILRSEGTSGIQEGVVPRMITGPGLYHTLENPPSPGTVRDLVETIGAAVVQVRTPGGLGSGFFINEDGYLITNFHVIEGETQISIEVFHSHEGHMDRKTYKEVRIIAMNKFQDLALLRVEDKDAPRFKFVPLSPPEETSVGEKVFAIGSPLGLERTVTEGIISTRTRQMQGSLYLQTNTQINPGNSGGPLFNMRGEVIGVTNMKVTFGEGLGFAIPIHTVRHFLDNRDAYAYDNDNPSNAYRYLPPPSRKKPAANTTSEKTKDKAEKRS